MSACGTASWRNRNRHIYESHKGGMHEHTTGGPGAKAKVIVGDSTIRTRCWMTRWKTFAMVDDPKLFEARRHDINLVDTARQHSPCALYVSPAAPRLNSAVASGPD